MKIGDVKVGEEYAAHDSPKWSISYRDTPRHVRVVEIVPVEKKVKVYSGASWGSTGTRNMRHVKIELLDEPEEAIVRWRREVMSAERGTQIVVEAKKLLGPWNEMSETVRKELAGRAARDEARASMKARLFGVLGGDFDDLPHVIVRGPVGELWCSADIEGEHLERLVSLAEEALAAK